MDILETIIRNKKKEVKERKALYSLRLLEKSIFFKTKPVSLRKYLLREDKSGIIAEFKRASPSKGDINLNADIEKTSIGYMQAGASALSILTDNQFFKGSFNDLNIARKLNFCPILQKDFIVDEYQVIEAKSAGADAILLIASALSKHDALRLGKLAKEFQMETLLEIHEESEIEYLNDYIDIAGVNNRNLKSFDISLEKNHLFSEMIPDKYLKISESGISKPEEILELRRMGYQGFLIGTRFMSSTSPHKACKEFILRMKEKETKEEPVLTVK